MAKTKQTKPEKEQKKEKKKTEVYEKRAERHVIPPSSPFFSMLKGFCHDSKNLYNYATYKVRDKYFTEGIWLRYEDLDSDLKKDEKYPDYRNMPTAQSAQQTLRLVDQTWNSYFKAKKEYYKDPKKFLGKPRPPKYKEKDGHYTLVLTNQECKLKEDGKLHFPKVFNGLEITPKFTEREDFVSFQQFRAFYDGTNIVVELVYRILKTEFLPSNGKFGAIDIGVDNLAALATNTEDPPLLINGKPLKSMNQYYNKKLAKVKSCLEKRNKKKSSKRIKKLNQKRNRKIMDYMHKASKRVVEELIKRDIHTLIIGKNKNWKQNSKLSKKVNQNFVQIPSAKFIELLKYKAEEKGITVILTNESYTSGTSFLDDELPVKKFYNKSRRKHRGLFVSNKGKRINADVNGAFQIMRKAIPNACKSYGIEGFVLNPFVVTTA